MTGKGLLTASSAPTPAASLHRDSQLYCGRRPRAGRGSSTAEKTARAGKAHEEDLKPRFPSKPRRALLFPVKSKATFVLASRAGCAEGLRFSGGPDTSVRTRQVRR